MTPKFLQLLFATTIILASMASTAIAEEKGSGFTIKKLLLMPGKVTQSHAEFESNCDKCHVEFEDAPQNNLCLDCHESVQRDFRTNRGFHGKVREVRKKPCRECHTDHKGRDYNIILLDRDNFDHRQTNFPLEGKHKITSCNLCHKNEKNYRIRSYTCFDCHKEDDAHNGEYGKECNDCHTPNGWKQSDFNHDTTGFPLRYKHVEVQCASCHVNNVFENTPNTCVGCHKIDDVHVGRFGDSCDDCHSPRGWKITTFDHNRDTNFTLRYRHAEITCEDCHKRPIDKFKMRQDCYSCHKKDDVHNGRNGKSCDDCHNERSWGKSSFDHNLDTNFKLLGSHKDVDCEACHTSGNLSDNIGRTCYSCHKTDDSHRGSLGKECQDCHNEVRWNYKIIFSHDMTKFPLLGMHNQVACGECHLTQKFNDAKTNCYSCHKKDDKHKGTLGATCERCHTPNDWGLWKFDHDRETNFPLEGAHKAKTCELCHRPTLPNPENPSMLCITCHKQDDVHNGRFGEDCQACHTTKSFKDTLK